MASRKEIARLNIRNCVARIKATAARKGKYAFISSRKYAHRHSPNADVTSPDAISGL